MLLIFPKGLYDILLSVSCACDMFCSKNMGIKDHISAERKSFELKGGFAVHASLLL